MVHSFAQIWSCYSAGGDITAPHSHISFYFCLIVFLTLLNLFQMLATHVAKRARIRCQTSAIFWIAFLVATKNRFSFVFLLQNANEMSIYSVIMRLNRVCIKLQCKVLSSKLNLASFYPHTFCHCVCVRARVVHLRCRGCHHRGDGIRLGSRAYLSACSHLQPH